MRIEKRVEHNGQKVTVYVDDDTVRATDTEAVNYLIHALNMAMDKWQAEQGESKSPVEGEIFPEDGTTGGPHQLLTEDPSRIVGPETARGLEWSAYVIFDGRKFTLPYDGKTFVNTTGRLLPMGTRVYEERRRKPSEECKQRDTTGLILKAMAEASLNRGEWVEFHNHCGMTHEVAKNLRCSMQGMADALELDYEIDMVGQPSTGGAYLRVKWPKEEKQGESNETT